LREFKGNIEMVAHVISFCGKFVAIS